MATTLTEDERRAREAWTLIGRESFLHGSNGPTRDVLRAALVGAVHLLDKLDAALVAAEAERDAERARRERLHLLVGGFLSQHAASAKLNGGERAVCRCPQCEEARTVLTEEHD